MIAATSIVTIKTKIALGFLAASILAALDSQVPNASAEDITLKAALAVAVVVLWRLVLKQQAEHKLEMATLRNQYETDMKTVVTANTASNEKVAQLAEEQATYFKTVTRSIVDEKLHSKAGDHPPIP